jgi:hypothetical protein
MNDVSREFDHRGLWRFLLSEDIQLPDTEMRVEAVGFGINEQHRQTAHSRSKIYIVERFPLSEQHSAQ